MARPTPDNLASTGSEDGNQAALFCWIADGLASQELPEVYGLLFAIPNGGKRGDDPKSRAIAGGRMKQTGVKAGVPDMFWPYPTQRYAGLFIELKRPSSKNKNEGKIAENQEPWHEALRAQRYCVVTCVGWESAKSVMQAYHSRRI